jgi:hypothetical protein
MQIGMTLPVMEPGQRRATWERWAREVDRGPFSSLAFGERMAFDNPELMALLGACAAWREAGRTAPRLVIAFWYALGPGAREQITGHLRGYLNWLDPREVEAMLPQTGFAGSAPELRAFLRAIAGLGADEALLIPTSADPDEIARAADVVA